MASAKAGGAKIKKANTLENRWMIAQCQYARSYNAPESSSSANVKKNH
jgi:hypothetical protein